MSTHRAVVQNDIRQAARLIALFDYKRKLFGDAAPAPTSVPAAEPAATSPIKEENNEGGDEDGIKEEDEEAEAEAATPKAEAPSEVAAPAPVERPKDIDAIVAKSKNPILDGVFEYFVEETSAEEEELLGVTTPAGDDLKIPLEIDRSLIAYLDKLLLYLRVVHSIDYYNHCEYSNEDNMPNR